MDFYLMTLAVVIFVPIAVMLDVDQFAGKFFSIITGTKV